MEIHQTMQTTITQLTAPKTFRTLRERCGITLNLTLASHSNNINYTKQISQPTFGKLPRRKKPTAIPKNPPPVSSPPSIPPQTSAFGSKLKKNIFHRRQRRNAKWIAVSTT
jgi:hypothetical protein